MTQLNWNKVADKLQRAADLAAQKMVEHAEEGDHEGARTFVAIFTMLGAMAAALQEGLKE